MGFVYAQELSGAVYQYDSFSYTAGGALPESGQSSNERGFFMKAEGKPMKHVPNQVMMGII